MAFTNLHAFALWLHSHSETSSLAHHHHQISCEPSVVSFNEWVVPKSKEINILKSREIFFPEFITSPNLGDLIAFNVRHNIAPFQNSVSFWIIFLSINVFVCISLRTRWAKRQNPRVQRDYLVSKDFSVRILIWIPRIRLLLRCFHTVFQRPYRYSSIALKVVFSPSDR